jgi:hypothetical protein
VSRVTVYRELSGLVALGMRVKSAVDRGTRYALADFQKK